MNSAERSRTGRKVELREALADLRIDATTWGHVRAERFTAQALRVLRRVLWLGMLALLLAVGLVAAVILLLIGLADVLAAALGVGIGIGLVIVGAFVLLVAFGAVGLLRSKRSPRQLRAREQELSTAMRRSSRRLGRELLNAPGMAAAVLFGAVSARVLSHPSGRRYALTAYSAYRALRRWQRAAGGFGGGVDPVDARSGARAAARPPQQRAG